MLGVAKFVDIVKIIIMGIKATYKDSIKANRTRQNASKLNRYLYFSI